MRKFMIAMMMMMGCGKHGGSDASATAPQTTAAAPSTSMLVESKDALPTCDSARSGQLAYVKGESKFYGCDGAAWAEISIKGDKGEKGEATETSVPATNKVVRTTYCSGQGTVNVTVDFTAYYVNYWATEMTSGDVWVTATVKNTVIGATETRYYAKAQSGADTAPVQITFDSYGASNSGSWQIELNRSTNVMTATYTDSGLPTTGSRYWVYSSSACTVQTF